MNRDTRELGKTEYDLIVIGGGIFGACAAWDASSRGLKTALLEKRDFSHATSANHLKMVHGGIRYMQHGDVIRVRESSRERAALLRIASHIVRPLPVIMPTYGNGKKGKLVLGTGVCLYDLLTLDRNRRIRDSARQIPRGRLISRQEVLDLFPALETRGLTGAAVFYDGQMYNPPRLALSFLRSASAAGAQVANYIEVIGFLRQGNRVVGIQAKDVVSGEELEVRGKTVLNTAGPWAASLLMSGLDLTLRPSPVFSRDVCFVVSRRLSGEFALACQTRTQDADAILHRGGRHLFLAPWREHTLVGVWHGMYEGSPDGVNVTREELQGFLDETNEAYPGISLSLADVTMVNTGLILFAENRPDAAGIHFGKRSILIDHGKNDGIEGVVTLIGVRATTARGMAVRAVDLAFRKMGVRPPKSGTSTIPIYGGRIDDFENFLHRIMEQRPYGLDPEVIHSLIHNYGSEYGKVLRQIDRDPGLAQRVPGSSVLKAEILHAIREEMAETLGDVVFRRTDLATAGHPGEQALATCAELMARELGWDGERVRKEVAEVTKEFPDYGSGADRERMQPLSPVL